MKLLGIVFQSTQQPNRLSLFADKVESLQEGMARAAITVTNEQGQLGWVPIITTLRDVPDAAIPSPIQNIETVTKGEKTTSWIMKTVIINKDTVLFDCVKKYLTEPESLYIEAQINADRIIQQ